MLEAFIGYIAGLVVGSSLTSLIVFIYYRRKDQRRRCGVKTYAEMMGYDPNQGATQ